MRKSAAVHPWLVRLSWLVVPFTAGTAIAGALDGRAHATQIAVALALWGAWAAVVVGLLVPRPAGLVGIRVAAAALIPVVIWSADTGYDWAVAGAHAAVMLALAMAPMTAEWLVNGTAYGYERRYLLRAPAPLLVGPMVLAALLLPAAAIAGPLLLVSQ